MRMFKSRLRTGGVLINVLIAVAVSLIVNFSYFVFMILHRTARMPSEHPVSENSTLFMVLEVLFYMAVSFILLTVFTHNLSESKIRSRSFPKRLLAALVISVVVYFLAPYMNRAGDVKIILAARRLFNPMVLLKCSFMLAVVTLYGKIYELIVLQQRMTVENERLKTENLRSRYDVLINQMNPHFFFNSLNSLAMLVRENKNDDALVYIDRLSDTFRYIIQSGKSSMTTLRDEMAFLEAYKYLLELRYEGKLFIEAEIPDTAVADASSARGKCGETQYHHENETADGHHLRAGRLVACQQSPAAQDRRFGEGNRNRAQEHSQPVSAADRPGCEHNRRRKDLYGAFAPRSRRRKERYVMRVVIVEDETAAAVNLVSLLRQTFPRMEVVAQLESVTDTVEWFSENEAPELVFMDIHLADGSAFSVFEKAEITCPVVFTTAYDQYALDAFRVNSIDYLLKPIKESDLRRAVEKLEHLTRAGMGEYSRRIGELVRSQRGAQAFLVYVKDRIIPLKTEDIAYLYSSNEKVAVCTLKGEHFPFDRTLDAVMAQLPEEGFFRANRQFVISREAIADISVWFGNRLSVNLSVEVPEKVVISKARVPEFKRWISGIR